MKKFTLAALILTAAMGPARSASYDDLNAAIQLYNLGSWDAAIQKLDLALAAKDLVPSLQFIAHFDRGQSHLALGHDDLAIADFSACLNLRPGDAMALNGRALAYLRAAKADEAATDLDNLVAARPFLSSAYGARAIVNLKRGLAGKSADDLKKVISLRPEHAPRSLGAGILFWTTGQIAEAEDNFSHAADRGAGNIYSWMWDTLAQVRLHKDVPRRSLPDFDKQKWPAPIVNLFLGQSTQEAVFAAAAQGDANAVSGQTCEANFYVGEWLLQHQDRASATPLIRKAAADCPMDFIEWNPAQMELAGLS